MKHKVFKIIEVPAAETPSGGFLCFSYSEQDCKYFNSGSNCKMEGHYPRCEDSGIIYLGVEDNA